MITALKCDQYLIQERLMSTHCNGWSQTKCLTMHCAVISTDADQSNKQTTTWCSKWLRFLLGRQSMCYRQYKMTSISTIAWRPGVTCKPKWLGAWLGDSKIGQMHRIFWCYNIVNSKRNRLSLQKVWRDHETSIHLSAFWRILSVWLLLNCMQLWHERIALFTCMYISHMSFSRMPILWMCCKSCSIYLIINSFWWINC